MSGELQFLPIGSDLSMNSLKWALEIGEEKKLGQAIRVTVSPEILFIARELLAIPQEEKGLKYFLELHQSEKLQPHSWQVEFEKGTIRSNAIWNEL